MNAVVPDTRDGMIEEIRRCRDDPWYFMTRWVYTLHRDTGKTLFPDYPYVKDLCYLLHTEQFLVILKSRQMFGTWLVVAYFVWDCLFHTGIVNVVTSYRQEEVMEMIKRAKFIYDSLPTFLRPSLGTENKKELEWIKRHSRLIGIPAVGAVGSRSRTVNRIAIDECGHLRNAEDFYTAAKPSLGVTGQVVLLSTSNGVGNFFGRIYSDLIFDF